MPDLDPQKMAQSPVNIWLAIALAGGLGVGSDFIPGNEGVSKSSFDRFVASSNAAQADLREAVDEIRTARDEEEELDHLWVRCARRAMDCSTFKPSSDEDDD